MSTAEISSETSVQARETGTVELKLEVVILPVSDAERSKQFYASLGWREDADFVFTEDFRVLQFTPPGSQASIIFGAGVTAAVPGAGGNLLLAVDDVEAARADLIARGVDVSEVFHGVAFDASLERRVPGLDPERKSYGSYASFSDPDGNEWMLQEVTSRLPGRVEETGVATLADLLLETARHAGRPAARDGQAARPLREGRPGPRLVGLVRALPRRARARQHAGAGRRGRRPLHEGRARDRAAEPVVAASRAKRRPTVRTVGRRRLPPVTCGKLARRSIRERRLP
jgi:catechol 2,3-dioxygenase-like lactoylglutathione lyase family enzyme